MLKFPIKKTNYFLKRNINQLNNILKNGYKNRSVHKCGFREIMKELENYDSDVERNFKKSLSEYLDYLANERNIEKIFIVSFPHKRHLEKTYSVDVSDYINDTLSLSKDKRISYINMSKIDFSNWFLHRIDSPIARNARGFARGSFYDQQGRLIASCAQEGLMRMWDTPKKD